VRNGTHFEKTDHEHIYGQKTPVYQKCHNYK